MNYFENKSIIHGMPNHSGIYKVIKKNLESIGFEVNVVIVTFEKFRYKNFGQRVHNFYRKLIFQDFNYKKKLEIATNRKNLIDKVNNLPKSDYALIIRPDLFPMEAIDLIRKKSDYTAGYQWDGLNRYPDIENYIPMFNKFFVFDKQDMIFPNVFPTTNFFLSIISKTDEQVTSIKSAYFIGSYISERMLTISKIIKTLQNLNILTKSTIFTGLTGIPEEIDNVLSLDLIPTDKIIMYEENLQNVIQADILIDVHNPIHNGLSFRIFEGLGYNKKVITTNEAVEHYDFYSEHNIFIWRGQEQDISKLKDFVSSPYMPLSVNIQQKYSFENWIKYILEKDEFIPISLP